MIGATKVTANHYWFQASLLRAEGKERRQRENRSIIIQLLNSLHYIEAYPFQREWLWGHAIYFICLRGRQNGTTAAGMSACTRYSSNCVAGVTLFFGGGGEVCHVTCGIFIPLSGIELGPTLVSESIDKVLITGLPESSPKCQFFWFTKQPCRNHLSIEVQTVHGLVCCHRANHWSSLLGLTIYKMGTVRAFLSIR